MSQAQDPTPPTDTPTQPPAGSTDNPAPPPADAGAGEKPWFDGLPDDLKNWTGLAKYKSLPDAITAMKAAESKLGAPPDQLLRLPKTPDDKEGLAAIFKALGAPDSPDGYQFKLPENLAEADKAAVAGFAKHMHEAGPFPPSVVSAAVNWWTAEVARQEEAAQAELATMKAAGEAQLREAWGAAYDQRTKEVGALISELGGEALVKELNASTLGDHPALAMALAKVVEMRAEGGPSGDGQRADISSGVMTPQQARAHRLEMEADAEQMKALMDASHPQHKAVVEKRNRFFAAEGGRAA